MLSIDLENRRHGQMRVALAAFGSSEKEFYQMLQKIDVKLLSWNSKISRSFRVFIMLSTKDSKILNSKTSVNI